MSTISEIDEDADLVEVVGNREPDVFDAYGRVRLDYTEEEIARILPDRIEAFNTLMDAARKLADADRALLDAGRAIQDAVHCEAEAYNWLRELQPRPSAVSAQKAAIAAFQTGKGQSATKDPKLTAEIKKWQAQKAEAENRLPDLRRAHYACLHKQSLARGVFAQAIMAWTNDNRHKTTQRDLLQAVSATNDARAQAQARNKSSAAPSAVDAVMASGGRRGRASSLGKRAQTK